MSSLQTFNSVKFKNKSLWLAQIQKQKQLGKKKQKTRRKKKGTEEDRILSSN